MVPLGMLQRKAYSLMFHFLQIVENKVLKS